MNFIIGALGISSAIQAYNQQQSANAAMRDRLRLEMDQYDKRLKIAEQLQGMFANLQNVIKAARDRGFFDENGRVQQLRTSVQQALSRNMDNIASAAKTMGYRPGDSLPQQQLAMAQSNASRNLATGEQTARRQAFMDELSAQQAGANLLGEASNIIGGASGQAAGSLGQDAAYHMGQVPDFSGLIGAAGPYFDMSSNKSSSAGVGQAGNGGLDFLGDNAGMNFAYQPNYANGANWQDQEFNLGNPMR